MATAGFRYEAVFRAKPSAAHHHGGIPGTVTTFENYPQLIKSLT